MYPILFTGTEYKHYPAIAGLAVAGLSIVGDNTAMLGPFTSQGLGTLSDAISCVVYEERNGLYELEMQYPISGAHFEDIQWRYFILAKPNYYDDPQPFRIYKITKPLNGICTIYAQHISYDLSGMECPAGISATGCTEAFTKLNLYADYFTLSTELSGSSAFSTDVPASVRSWFGGKEGSLIDLYGGEWKYDLYSCKLMSARGSNRGVTIRYGKNLTTLEQEEECSNLCTAVRAYYQDSSSGKVYTSDLISTGITLEPDKVLIIDANEDFDEIPTTAQLNARATAYINENNLRTPKVNLELDFVQMQYLDRVDLCDTVTVIFEELGVNATAKCIRTEWDVLKDRYQGITIGDAKSSFAETIEGVSQKVAEKAVKKGSNDYIEAINNATQLITGNKGGYVVIHDSDGDDYPDEILIMNEPNIEDATKVWRWNKNGLGYSSTGYEGTYGLAMTQDGAIVADYITSGTMSANRILGGTLKLGGYNNEYGILKMYNDDDNLELILRYDGLQIYNDGTYIGSFRSSHYTDATINAMVISARSPADRIDFQFYDSSQSLYYARYRFFDEESYGFVVNSEYATGGSVAQTTCRLSTQTYGGNLRLYNTSGALRLEIGVSSSDAGNFYLNNTSGNAIVRLSVNNNAGWLSLNNSSGTYRVRAGVNTSDNGWLTIFNTSSNDAVRLLVDSSYNGGRLYLNNSSGSARVESGVNSSDGGYINLYNTSGTTTVQFIGSSGAIYMLDDNSNPYKIRAVMKTTLSSITPNSYGCYNTGLSATTYTVLSARAGNSSTADGYLAIPFVAYGTWWINFRKWQDNTACTSGSFSPSIFYIRQA